MSRRRGKDDKYAIEKHIISSRRTYNKHSNTMHPGIVGLRSLNLPRFEVSFATNCITIHIF